MIEELVSRVFAARNAAHLEHWRTQSYAKHVALGDFYDSVIDSVDKFVEVYQGFFGLIGDIPQAGRLPLDALGWMTGQILWLTENEQEICRNNLMLQNIYEELSGIYSRTNYKLRNLK